MAWLSMTDAASALGCTERTIRRRVRAGQLDVRRDGHRSLVEIDTDRAMDTVTGIGRQMSEVATATAIQRRQDSDLLGIVVAELQSARRTARVATVMSVMAVIVMGGIVAWLGTQFHTMEVGHIRAASENRRLLDSAVSEAVQARSGQHEASLRAERAEDLVLWLASGSP